MPHGMCYLWDPTIVWINAVSDALIGLSYVAISVALSWLVHRARRDIPFTSVFIAFGLFIVACWGCPSSKNSLNCTAARSLSVRRLRAELRLPSPCRSAPAGIAVQAAPAETAQTDELARQALDELRHRVEAVAVTQEADRPLVLVIEDNLKMNRFLAETLAADYRVATAFDGQEGLQQALSLKPDLILSDVMMPQMSGDQVVREVRARAELDAIPVVLLTAKADDELRVRLLREGLRDEALFG